MKNKKNMFAGWKTVFDFTVKQTVGLKSFKIVTILIAIIAFVTLSAINVIYAFVNSDEEVKIEMKNAIICDETGLITDDLALFREMYADDIKDIDIELSNESAEKVADGYLENKKDVIVVKIYEDVYEEESLFKIDVLIPEKSNVKKKSAEKFSELFCGYFENIKLMNSGIEGEKLTAILSPVSVNINKTGEDADTIGEFLVKTLVPMIYAFALYMMLMLYGQNISKCVIMEKTSKLMETILTSVAPYAVITGKVVGVAMVALGQMLLWISSGIIGFLVGDIIAQELVPNYSNIVLDMIKLVQEDASSAFRPITILLFIIIMCLGFVMYSVFAAMLSSGVKQADKLNNAIAPYMMVVMVGFFVSYMTPISGGYKWLLKISNYIPPIAAYKLPGDLLVGSASIIETVVGISLMLVVTFILIVITGKIYKKKVF